MTTFTDYFKTEIASLNVTATTLEARLEKGRLMLDREKDPMQRNKIEIQFVRILNAYERCIAAIQVLTGIRPKESNKWCAVCSGLIYPKEVEAFFEDYEEVSTGKTGMPA